MDSSYFDPFNSRLARDIRNTLSRTFLHALKDRDKKMFERCVTDYLQQDLEPVNERYVKNRLEKYKKVFAIIQEEKIEDVLKQAAVFWDYGLYFEMHEILEPVWIAAKGGRRKALQGLIRAAGMKIHAESNNMKAAVSMGYKALVDLEKYSGELDGFARLGGIEAEIKQTLASTRNSTRQG